MMPIPRRHGARTPVSLVALLASGALLGACSSSFFRVTPENAAPAPVPAATPVEEPAVAPPPAPEPPAVASDSAGVARLMRIAMIWHIVRTHHPLAATDPEGWDAALVRNIPALRSASAAELPRAVNAWLGVLGDPETRVVAGEEARATERGAAETRLLGDSIALLRYWGSADSRQADSISRTLSSASRILIDARGAEDDGGVGLDGVVRSITRGDIRLPAVRAHLAGVDEWRIVEQELLATGTRSVSPRIVIVADARTVLSDVLAALAASGRAGLIVEEGFTMPGRYAPAAIPPGFEFRLTDDVRVNVRTSEWARWDGAPLAPDTVVSRAGGIGADSVPAIRVALAALRSGRLPQTPRTPLRALPRFSSDQPDAPWPAMGARLLAAFRVWGAMRDEHAHRDGYDDDIDATLERTIPAVERASNATQYAAALVDQVASFDDATVRLEGASRDAVRGVASAPFRARLIEGRAVVTALAPGAPAGIAVGTEITAVDGFPMTAWFTERRRTVTASNPWTRARDMVRDLPRGPEGDAMLRVRDVTGPERQITLPRTIANVGLLATPERTGDAARRIGDVAYLDVERLDFGRIADALQGSRAAILDLRSKDVRFSAEQYLQQFATSTPIVAQQWVTRARGKPCALPSREIGPRCSEERRIATITNYSGPVGTYRGRLVVLIDERTQGDAERLALALESGANATLIGSASAGAAAHARPIALPGQLTLFMPREEIRRADGGQLHRVGLTPAIEIRPTVRGIRAGTDEVLERALAFLAPAEPRRRR